MNIILYFINKLDSINVNNSATPQLILKIKLVMESSYQNLHLIMQTIQIMPKIINKILMQYYI